jgi:hypothetical protein
MVVFSVLIAAYVAVGLNPSFGWFAKNETVTANGMNTMAYHSQFKVNFQKLALNDDGTTSLVKDNATMADILADLKVPGQSVIFNVTIENISAYPVDITAFGLEAPSVQYEVPKVEGNKAHYLSTELNTSLVDISFASSQESEDENAVAEPTVEMLGGNDLPDPMFLRDANGAGRIDYFRWLKFEENKPQVITLENKKSVTFTVEITFVNKDKDQNVFKNFAEKGTCMRDVFFTFDESR